MSNDTSLSGISVLVAGAGLSGLVAARELRQRGARVTLIEARTRIGGRVSTRRDLFGDGQSAEAGGEMIDGDHDAVVQLIKDLELPLVRIFRSGFGAYRTSASGKRRLFVNAVRGWQRLGELAAREASWFRTADQRLDSAVAEALARESVADWLRRVNADAELQAIAQGLAGFFLASPEDLSLLSLVELNAEEDRPGQGRMFRIQGGNDRLTDALAAPFRDHIRLDAALESVTQHTRGITASLVDRGRRAQVRADYLISTIPASTLRDVSFTPALPELQDAAIRKLPYGPATKLLVQFDRRFWRGLGRPMAYATDLDIGAVWDANEEQRGQPGILAMLAGGRVSARAQAVSRQGPAALLRQLAWLRPGAARMLVSIETVWESDPWARGGYAYFDPAYDPSLRLWLSRPFNRVLFAGEHTSVRWQGYMNGAVESGRRAAVEIEAMEYRRHAG
jgi:monoamine oxidase